jgi:hypothetical protein
MVRDVCSECGISYDGMLSMTWREYDYVQRGHALRIERQFDVARHLIAGMYNSSGFAKKTVKAKDIITLNMLDDKPKKVSKRMDKETFERIKATM